MLNDPTQAPFLPMEQHGYRGYEARYKYDERFEVTQYHCHDFYELFIHISGGEYMGVDNRLFQLKPNQVFILPPFCMHGLSCTREMQNYRRGYLNISPEVMRALGCGQIDLEQFFHQHTSGDVCTYQLSDEDARSYVNWIRQIQDNTGADSNVFDRFRDCAAMISLLNLLCQRCIRLFQNGYAFINDYEGNILYHPRMDVLSMSEEEKPKVPENLITESTVTRYNYEGTGKIGVWLPLRNGTRLNVSVPVSEINGNWSQLVTTIICVAAVLLAVFVILAHHITGRITKPLTDLTDAAREVVGGNYDISLPYQGDDEAGVLTSAFRQLIAHLKTYIQDLHDLAYGDALTAVRNKGAFDIYLKGLQEQIDDPEANPEFAVCFFDCNDLKAINDTYGHEKGDMYLKNSCTMICQVFAHSPVFRIGGDEFAAVLTKGDYEHRDRLLALFDQRCYDLRAIGEQPWEQVNTARGIAVFNPRTDMTTEDVVRRADESMYANKKSMKQ